MSKQSDAKKEQGYVDKAIPAVCCTCENYTSETVKILGRYYPHTVVYTKEKNRRCALGWFAVKKNGTCKMHRFKENNYV